MHAACRLPPWLLGEGSPGAAELLAGAGGEGEGAGGSGPLWGGPEAAAHMQVGGPLPGGGVMA